MRKNIAPNERRVGCMENQDNFSLYHEILPHTNVLLFTDPFHSIIYLWYKVVEGAIPTVQTRQITHQEFPHPLESLWCPVLEEICLLSPRHSNIHLEMMTLFWKLETLICKVRSVSSRSWTTTIYGICRSKWEVTTYKHKLMVRKLENVDLSFRAARYISVVCLGVANLQLQIIRHRNK